MQEQKGIDASAGKKRTTGLEKKLDGGISSLKNKVLIVCTHTYFTYVPAPTPNVKEQKRIDVSAARLEEKPAGVTSSVKNKVLIDFINLDITTINR